MSTTYQDKVLLTESEIQTVMGFRIFSSILSLMGSLFIISIYIVLSIKAKCYRGPSATKRHHKPKVQNEEDYNQLKMRYGHDLIFFLAISDLLTCISTFIKTNNFKNTEIDAQCIAQGFILNFSEISSVCWTSVIAFSIYVGTWSQTDVIKYSKRYLWFFIYTYGTGIILTVGPLFSNSIGPAGAWCWLNTTRLESPSAWIWSLIIYIFHWLNIAFNLYAVIRVIRYFKIRAFEIKEGNEKQANFLRDFCIVLKFFPIILILCWIFPTINRIVLFATKTEMVGLYCVSAFFGRMQGFLNALVYSYYYKNILGSCCKGNNTESSISEMQQNPKEKTNADKMVNEITLSDIKDAESGESVGTSQNYKEEKM